MSTKVEATIEDLYAVEGKAEIVNGEIIYVPPTGDVPGYAGDEVFSSLRQHARDIGGGRAVGDNKGFLSRIFRTASPSAPMPRSIQVVPEALSSFPMRPSSPSNSEAKVTTARMLNGR